MLSGEYKSIFVDSFANQIKISDEQSDARMYRGYRPGMETEVTKDIIDKYLSDGNLKIAKREDSTLILEGALVDFRKEPLRYDANDNIEEYRVIVEVNMELKDAKSGKVIWNEKNFSGEATYRTAAL